uniref:Uncharacterized protein n=1 Tax=Acrobeloides nanus TaxID=290746 RepID=A0A914D4V1_9BILA
MFETPADIDIPSGVIGVSCLPKPLESLQHGIRLRILCYHKKSTMKAQLHDTKRYHWLNVQSPKVLSHLCLLPNQFQPALFML